MDFSSPVTQSKQTSRRRISRKKLELLEFFGSASVDMSKFIVKMNVTVSTQTLSNGRKIFHFTIISLIIDFSNNHLSFETRGNVIQAIAENYKK